MLELHDIRTLLPLVAFPIIYILFYEGSWEGGAFLIVSVIFPKILGRLSSDLC